jgi:stage II sporulation protein M
MKKKKRENINLKKEYKQSFRLLKETKNYIFSIIGLFIFFILVGFLFPAPEEISNVLLEYINQLLKMTQDMNVLELGGFIFFNNFFSSLFSMVFGVIFGTISLISTIVNAYLIGFVSLLVVGEEGFISLWKLFPHGIFELPAIFISLGLGLRLGLKFIEKKLRVKKLSIQILILILAMIILPLLLFIPSLFFSKIILQNLLTILILLFTIFIFKKDKDLLNYLKESMRVFLFIVLPLLIIAAIIETGLIFSLN